MSCPLDKAWMVGNPDGINREIRARDGREARFRLLARGDAVRLGCYFEGLSEATRRLYGPHPLNADEARRIAGEYDHGGSMRFLAEAGGEVIAYFIVLAGFLEADKARYRQYGLVFDDGPVGTLAPSVAEAWQSAGLGSAMLREIVPLLARMGFSWLVLWGGTQAGNKRAIHFYEKFGFRRLGVFQTTANGSRVDNYDMAMELGDGDCAMRIPDTEMDT